MASALVLLGLSGSQAFALSLGRLSVQSALGEPLRAEVDVPEITAEEAASLRAAVAAPDAFTAAGLEYSPALAGLQVSLQRRTDGRAYLRLTSDRTVSDPFVDLILEATWASGRIVRDYTLLLDPPSLKKAPPAPTLAQTPAAAPAPSEVSAAPAPSPAKATPSESNRASAAPRAATRPAAAPAPTTTEAVKPAPDADARVTVKTGDTASKIASIHKPAGISLDQMLVALLRSNPDAFIRDNLNRVRAGAVVTIPSAAEAGSVAPADASKIVVAQSKDFNDFRRNLASNAPQAAVGNADRKTSGTVDAKVDDKKPASPAPDKLTLSKGAIATQNEQAKIAKAREAQDAAARAAEIAKNISDLNKIAAGSAPVAAPAAPAPAAKPAAPEVPVAAVTPSAAPVPVPVPVPAPSPAPAQAEAPASAVAAVPAPALEEPSLLDSLMEDPMVPLGAAGLLALLGGYGFYRVRQRRLQNESQDSAFLESRLQPDSFFGASGGQRVDTDRNDKAGPESMTYSASQLDAADDVDPVAEADVYLAYGRDKQAEEILKEALRTNPERLAIHSKMLEIYAKRRDVLSFESTATQVHTMTDGTGPGWNRICAWGLSIDPNNPLYQPGYQPGGTPAATESGATSSLTDTTIAQPADVELAPTNDAAVDLDLDLDFSADDQAAPTDESVTSVPTAQDEALAADIADNALDMDLDLDLDIEAAPDGAPSTNFTPVIEMPDISLSLDDLDLSLDDSEPATAELPAQPAPAPSTDLMDFDLEALSMELDAEAQSPVDAPDNLSGDPMGTKLELAEEFISIGDEDGARALIEEVLEEATGEMLAKAQKALAQLS